MGLMIYSISLRVTTLVCTLAMILSFVPGVVAAQDDTSDRPARDTERSCELVDTAREIALSRLSDRRASSDRTDEIMARRDTRLDRLNTDRNDRKSIREGRYELLRDRGNTDVWKAAVDEFADTVEGLVSDRIAAVDVAIEEFEDTVENLLDERRVAIDDYADGISDDLNAIFDEAAASCEAGDTPADIRAALKQAITELRVSIAADRGKYSFKDELAVARETRTAAIADAKDTFQAGYQESKTDLKSALATEQ